MENKTITAKKGNRYLSDFMTELPSNCILSKGITGCGATTLAIEQKQHTIIAMPFVGLIDNKVEQYPETLLGIYGAGDKKQEIKDYLNSHDTVKILTTYDSLQKVTNVLQDLDFDPLKKAHLAVDEWHILFNSYDYRYKGIRRLLDTAPLFDKVTYISATPIEHKYYLQELKHLPEYVIEWPDAKPMNIRSHCVDKPIEYIAGICRNRIKNGGDSNYHIFLNSVDDISRITNTVKLTSENCRIVCSTSEASEKKNLAKLGNNFTISKVSDEVKPINLYTSTCFEGQDIFDVAGRTFIVSNASKKHTLMDISTSFIQICGRLRNSQYNDEIIHFYSTSRYKDVSLEEFEKVTENELLGAENYITWINSAPDKYREETIKQIPHMNIPYITVDENNKLTLDRNLANFDMVNYKIVNGIYQSKTNVITELRQNGLNVTNDDSYIAPESIELVTKLKLPFKDLFDLYCEIIENQPLYSLSPDYRIELIENQKPLIKEAYNKLGRSEVVRMNYHQHNIKREIIKRNNKSSDYKIVELINETLSHYEAMPISKVKAKLQGIYDTLGLERKAKATDLNNWYETKPQVKMIDSKSTACITIVRDKFMRVE